MKVFFKKTWVFIKAYWYIFVIVIFGILALLLGKNKDIKKIFKLIDQERSMAREEIKIIEETHKKKDKELEENLEKYVENKEKLDKKHEKDVVELEKRKYDMEVELANRIEENPSKVLGRIAKEMGWDYEHG